MLAAEVAFVPLQLTHALQGTASANTVTADAIYAYCLHLPVQTECTEGTSRGQGKCFFLKLMPHVCSMLIYFSDTSSDVSVEYSCRMT
jgi:hypothetical protein